MSKPWGGIGAWADEAERADEERAIEATATPTADSQSFPSLKEAANAKTKKKKKMTLSEFTMGYAPSGKGSVAVGLTPAEMIRLPTGPRERSQDEMLTGRLGGGFSSYGRSNEFPGRMMRDRNDSDGSWGGGRRSYGGFDDEQKGPPSRVSDFTMPSRADEVDDWGKTKKSLPSFDQGRHNRYGGVGDNAGDRVSSKADEVDNWAAGKRLPPVRSSTFGGGFRESVPDRWTRGVTESDVQAERPRLVLEPRKTDSGATGSQTHSAGTTNKPNPFGAARPREEVLTEKGLDWKKIESEMEAKKGSLQTSRPRSSQSNMSDDSALNSGENVVKPRQKVNPFGNAKPREVLLEERGQDWRKVDFELEHRRVDRVETEEEKTLKEEIEELKKQFEKETQKPSSNESHQSLSDAIRQKEHDLETLMCELDDKIRFRQKASGRPGSSSFSERSHSRSESFDESRSFESTERPRSRGAVDAWVRPVDDRRSFHGSKEQRGFFSNGNFERPSSRERRW